MNYLEGLQEVLDYIEEHINEEIDYKEMAAMVGYSTYHFQRLFVLLTGVTTAEYIRCRRLAMAAADLLDGENTVLEVGLKYGYNSPTAFNRAFKAMHGVVPSEVKKPGATVKAFPRVILDRDMKPAGKMEYRIEKLDQFRIVGKRITTTMEGGACYQAVPGMWMEMVQSGGPGSILALMNQQPMGLLGISDYDPEGADSSFDYYIAVSSSQPIPEGMHELTVQAVNWAVFSHKNSGPQDVQEFQKRIVMEWLPSSGYEFGKGPDMELYYQDDRMETWIPIARRENG